MHVRAVGIRFVGKPLTVDDLMRLEWKPKTKYEFKVIALYSYTDPSGSVTQLIQFSPAQPIVNVRHALGNPRVVPIVVCCQDMPFVCRYFGRDRLCIRKTLYDNRNSPRFSAFITRTLAVDIFGDRNPNYHGRKGRDVTTDEEEICIE